MYHLFGLDEVVLHIDFVFKFSFIPKIFFSSLNDYRVQTNKLTNEHKLILCTPIYSNTSIHILLFLVYMHYAFKYNIVVKSIERKKYFIAKYEDIKSFIDRHSHILNIILLILIFTQNKIDFE